MPGFALMLACLLSSAEDGAVAAMAVSPSPIEPHCSRRLEVLGFADNERALAIMQHVSCPRGDGTTDHYDLIDLMETHGRTVVASYQGSPIGRRHTKAPHKPVFVLPGALAAQHPSWRHASPMISWVKIKRAGHFRRRLHDFKDVMVRVRPDADSPMDVHAEGTRLLLTAPQDKPIGCQVVGRLVDGSEIDLGHVRDEAQAQHMDRGHIEVAFSAHGHLVAMVHHGMGKDAVILTKTPHTQPIASTQVGFLQMLRWDAASVKELYGDLHPEGKKVWDEMVGVLE